MYEKLGRDLYALICISFCMHDAMIHFYCSLVLLINILINLVLVLSVI